MPPLAPPAATATPAPAAPATPAQPASSPASTTRKAMPLPPPKPPARTPVQSRTTGKRNKHNPCQERREQAQSVRAKEEARVRMFHAQQVHQQELELQAQQCQQSLQGPESLFWRGIWLQRMAQAVGFIFASHIGGRVEVTLALCLLLACLLLAFIYQ